MDWYKAKEGHDFEVFGSDPGALLFQTSTTTGQLSTATRLLLWAQASVTSAVILELAGCDRLTIAPQLSRPRSS
ncbi:hypothetical protein O9929_26140 [Vibrio lentus]|nr:hypothetical protein [Vibrio lentus]